MKTEEEKENEEKKKKEKEEEEKKKEDEKKKEEEEKKKEEEEKATAAAAGNDEYDDEDFDEAKWQCNGVVYFPEGCKSNQLGFDYHEGVEGWQCPDKDNCDFDLCDMCIRWIIHCEKNRIVLTWRS